MAAGDGGSIINISSTGAVRPTGDIVPYSAAKAGLNALTLGSKPNGKQGYLMFEHPGSDEKMRSALANIQRAGCRFLVAGRKTGERFETLGDIALPPEFANVFSAIPPEDFRANISSTQLRRDEPS
jgi:NAD(P)-dependent dehydrogenase (short-subunit alcohol dehydrogenase family)